MDTVKLETLPNGAVFHTEDEPNRFLKKVDTYENGNIAATDAKGQPSVWAPYRMVVPPNAKQRSPIWYNAFD